MAETLNYLILVVAGGNLITACVFGYFIWLANWRRTLALQGDLSSAVRIILPCYRPLFRWFLIMYVLTAGLLVLAFYTHQDYKNQFFILQYASLMMLIAFSVCPIFLLQKSISYTAFYRTAYVIVPWFVCCTVLWGFMNKDHAQIEFQITFWAFSGLPAIIIGIGMLSGLIQSRVHLKSWSNRNAIEYMLVYALFYSAINVVSIAPLNAGDRSELVYISTVSAIFTFFWNIIFPWALYRTLLADTKFWRGLGRHNQQGFQADGNVFRPTVMDIRLVSHDLQGAMREIGDVAIDFAFLEIGKKIGEGAHAHVFNGSVKEQKVAVKLYTPEEVNQEIIQEFVREAKLSRPLQHPNIVSFSGICIRPPQIAMMMELCDGGNLKSNLITNSQHWTPVMRIMACLDAAHALMYFHKAGYIHRDIKAENFFVRGDVTQVDKNKVLANLGNGEVDVDFDTGTAIDMDSMRGSSVVGGGSAKSVKSNRGRSLSNKGMSMSLGMRMSGAAVQTNSTIKAAQDSDFQLSMKGFVVKLGDFGESTKQRINSDGTVRTSDDALGYDNQAHGKGGDFTEEDSGLGFDMSDDDDNDVESNKNKNRSRRMSIKGTVAFQAPELVAAKRMYSESVDIYSLAITFWEIWTGEDPYDGLDTFQVYQQVEKGLRPVIPKDMPQGLQRIIEQCWSQESETRPNCASLAIMLESLISDQYEVNIGEIYPVPKTGSPFNGNGNGEGGGSEYESITGLNIRQTVSNMSSNMSNTVKAIVSPLAGGEVTTNPGLDTLQSMEEHSSIKEEDDNDLSQSQSLSLSLSLSGGSSSRCSQEDTGGEGGHTGSGVKNPMYAHEPEL